jgi:hypothetical protein
MSPVRLDVSTELNHDEVGRIRVGDSLHRWLQHHWRDGVQIDTLEELSLVHAWTQNTLYEVVVACGAPGDVLVHGGRYFPDWTAARLVGSTRGGSLLKQFGIHPGWRIEFRFKDRVILTSPVRSVVVRRPDPDRKRSA